MPIPNRGPELLGVNIGFVATATLAYSLRCFVRVKMMKAFGLDDWLMGLALLSMIAYVVSSNIGVFYGTGRHHWDLSTEHIEKARHCWWFGSIFYTWAMVFAKLSIGFLLLRISVKPIHTWLLYAAMLTCVVTGGSFFFTSVFQCWPVYRFWHDFDPQACISIDLMIRLSNICSTVSILFDFVLATIPAFLIWPLQLNRKTKIALIPLIAMGCIASAAAIARFPFMKYMGSHDFLWSTIDIAIWSTVEQGLAITASSLATIRPLYFLAMSHFGLSVESRASYGRDSGPPAWPLSSKTSKVDNEQKQNSLRSDVCNLATINNDCKSHGSDIDAKWYPTALSPISTKDPKWLSNRHQNDNESEIGLKMKDYMSGDEEDPMQTMVSKSFRVIDEERSLASCDTSYT
ncbi:hypothetical protein BDU57DRAFT_541439 [Ampelomyces quisqualis]|uniref:Rhodopsin domain-containing protein n=1 Tax=Ampelomyces quisqualis TaxID=50730 RepID=A0A6A5QFF9_AMPQU|nr:hypothetical protein BDU57DRAFT_541439 [Ampelomyces quisqualis]